jgi:hypothetical protein
MFDLYYQIKGRHSVSTDLKYILSIHMHLWSETVALALRSYLFVARVRSRQYPSISVEYILVVGQVSQHGDSIFFIAPVVADLRAKETCLLTPWSECYPLPVAACPVWQGSQALELAARSARCAWELNTREAIARRCRRQLWITPRDSSTIMPTDFLQSVWLLRRADTYVQVERHAGTYGVISRYTRARGLKLSISHHAGCGAAVPQ